MTDAEAVHRRLVYGDMEHRRLSKLTEDFYKYLSDADEVAPDKMCSSLGMRAPAL